MTASTGLLAANGPRNAAILKLRGAKSFTVIAAELGLTRNVVAGVMFRARHPANTRYSSSHGRRNKTGTGHHGHGAYAGQMPARKAGARA